MSKTVEIKMFMCKAPWRYVHGECNTDSHLPLNLGSIISDDPDIGGYVAEVCGDLSTDDEHSSLIAQANAFAIVSAVNHTYGSNIDPEGIPDVLDALKLMCEYFEWLVQDPDFPAYKQAKAAIEKAKLK